jgi:hypothetical protein
VTDAPIPCRGSIITYSIGESGELTAFLRAVVAGPPIVDPSTDALWIPALRADGVSTLIGADRIVDFGTRPLSPPWVRESGDRPVQSGRDADER